MLLNRRQWIFLGIMALMLLLDQGSKIWVRLAEPQGFHIIIPNFIDLVHVENRGVSFSMLGDLNDGIRRPLLSLISLAAMILIGVYWRVHRQGMNTWTHLAFMLILSGAAGNLIDRALFGTVTDFLHFRFYSTSFFVNNIADILISGGVVAYVIGAWKQHRADMAMAQRSEGK